MAPFHLPASTDRREWLTKAIGSFATFALLAEMRNVLAAAPAPASAWVSRQSQIAAALSAGELHPLAWMSEVERLAREVDVAELMALVDRSLVTPAPSGADNDPAKHFVRFRDEAGSPRRLPFGAALFDFAPRNVVTPHGHRNMVSAHLVVKGKLRVRTFDRVGDESGAMVIRPASDAIVGVGEVSTMSSARNNIHWFVPVGGPATTFDVVISGLDPAAPEYEIKAIDPVGGRKREDGAIVAPIMDFGAASRIYTADV